MEPPPGALILHTDLEPAWLQHLTGALAAAGYRVNLPTPEALSRFLTEMKEGRTGLLTRWLSENELLLLDEQIGGRCALEVLEIVQFLLGEAMGLPEDRRLCLLWSEPWGSTALAARSLGVHTLLDKRDAREVSRLPAVFEKMRRSARRGGGGFSMNAKWASNASVALVARLGVQIIEPDHLALILLTDKALASHRALTHLGVDVEGVRQEVIAFLGSQTVSPQPVRDFLTAAGEVTVSGARNRALECTYTEAWLSRIRFLSTAHLLLGILRAGEGEVCRALTRRGVTLEALREASEPFSVEEDAESTAYYGGGEADYEERWRATWERVPDFLT